MTLKEIIDGLNELILDRESFIEKDDPDSIFVHDAEVLREATPIPSNKGGSYLYERKRTGHTGID